MDKKKSRSPLGLLIFLVVLLLVMGGAYYFSHNYLVVFPIKGESMLSTLNNGDYVIIFKTTKVKYDDVIIFYTEEAGDKYLVKRVIGLEGDKIEIKYSEDDSLYHVYRNGNLVSEEHIFEPMDRNYTELSVIVPQGKVFFLGDNRLNSLDSHLGLFADVDQIQGIAFVRYTGWKDIKILK